MNKKMIFVVIVAFVCFFVICSAVYFSLKSYQENLFYEETLYDVKAFIETDSNFAQTYSTPVSVREYKENKDVESAGKRIWRIFCIVEGEDGKQYLVNAEINYYNNEVSYVSVTEQS